jgi:superfamily II DNA/RNA helicase
VILEGAGKANEQKTQCLLFSATTPSWVKEIGRQYQKDVLHIDSTTEEGGARVANTVRHCAVQLPPGADSKKSVLEDIIAVEISRDAKEYESDDENDNPILAAAKARKKKSAHAMQQKIFGKTIVFTETKKAADELVSGGIFKSLSAQALHGDVGQKQRDATLNAFRAGAFNVLVATDVAARGIDIQDVDLVVQFDPPRDVDTYVHRSGRTGRAGKKGVSVLLFNPQQAKDIVRIERDLGHGFKFDLVGPPSTEAALKAVAKTSALACMSVPDETAAFFREAAEMVLKEEDPVDIVARCLASISRRSAEVQSRSLMTGELGMVTVEMVNTRGRPVAANDVMFTVGKLARMSHRDGQLEFDGDVGKIQANRDTGAAIFDMSVEDAKKLVEFSKDVDAGGNEFKLLKELEVERDQNFGRSFGGRGGRGDGGRFSRSGGGRGVYSSGGRGAYSGGRGRGIDRQGARESGYRGNVHGQNRRSDHEGRQGRDGYRANVDNRSSSVGTGERKFGGRYDSRRSNDSGGW